MLSLGRWMAVQQAAQDAARFAAREVALYPLPAESTFASALGNIEFRRAVYDPGYLVVDLDATPPGPALEAFFAAMPVVNRAFRPLMITSNVDTPNGRRRLLHMPGAIIPSDTSPTGLSVVIPRVVERDPTTGAESIAYADVLEEIAVEDSGIGSFMVSRGGIAGLRLNVPFQSAALVAYLPQDAGGGIPIQASDAGIGFEIAGPGPGGAGPYSGSDGLGRLEALGQQVRPFRRLIAAQALFRREVVL